MVKDASGSRSRRKEGLKPTGKPCGGGDQPRAQTEPPVRKLREGKHPQASAGQATNPRQEGGRAHGAWGAACFAIKEILRLWNVYLVRNVNLQPTLPTPPRKRQRTAEPKQVPPFATRSRPRGPRSARPLVSEGPTPSRAGPPSGRRRDRPAPVAHATSHRGRAQFFALVAAT